VTTPRPCTRQEGPINLLGKLTWDSIPWSQPIPLVAGAIVILAVLAVILWVIVRGYLPYLWNEWITSVDHKRIGVMYLLLALLICFADLSMR
jgi:cytochrome o ubiquinol oxidase subunit I